MSLFTWKRGKHGTWSDASNWEGGAVPMANDDADISGGRANVRSPISVNSITSGPAMADRALLSFFGAGASTIAGDVDLQGPSSLQVMNSDVTVGGTTSAASIDITALTLNGATLQTGALDLPDTGAIALDGVHNRLATLDVQSTASFGSGSTINGSVALYGNSRIEFAGSDQFTSLAGTLDLESAQAVIADEGINATTNSALRGLNDISGTLNVYQGAQLFLAGRLHVEVGGSLAIGSGSALSESGALTNVGAMTIYGRFHLGSALVNHGKILIENGAGAEDTALDVKGNIYNSGQILFKDGAYEIASAVAGAGQVSLGYDATLALDGAVGQHQVFRFSPSESLTLNDAEHFAGQTRYFTHGDSFILPEFSAGTTFDFVENAAHTSGVLSVSDGTRDAHIIMGGSYSNTDFSLSDNGTGGVTIKSTR